MCFLDQEISLDDAINTIERCVLDWDQCLSLIDTIVANMNDLREKEEKENEKNNR